jgi:dihydropyrimidine dehydrogenase (NAD+) subunit PreA
VLIASIMAGSGSDKELAAWQTLARACQDQGADGLELNLSCPHMDRDDMGSNIGKDQKLCSRVTQVVKEVSKVPVWAKLTPSTTDIVMEAGAVFAGGGDAVVSSNTFLCCLDRPGPSNSMNVDGWSPAAAWAAPPSCPSPG